jgi:hypothetical protein
MEVIRVRIDVPVQHFIPYIKGLEHVASIDGCNCTITIVLNDSLLVSIRQSQTKHEVRVARDLSNGVDPSVTNSKTLQIDGLRVFRVMFMNVIGNGGNVMSSITLSLSKSKLSLNYYLSFSVFAVIHSFICDNSFPVLIHMFVSYMLDVSHVNQCVWVHVCVYSYLH